MVFLEQSLLSFKGMYSAFSKEEIFVQEFGYPIMSMVFYCLLAAYSFSTDNLTSWVVGNSFLLTSNTCIFSLGSFLTSDRYYGRLKFLFLSERTILFSLLEKSFFSVLSSSVVVILGLIIGSTFFKTDLRLEHLPILVIFILSAIFSTAMFGIFLSTFGLISDSMNLFLNTAYTALLILTGVNFPISYLPHVFQLFSKILPLTNSIKGVRDVISNGFSGNITFLVNELLIGIGYLLISVAMMKVTERLSITRGNIDLF